MDKETFIQQYADKSGLPVDDLLQWGVAIPAEVDWPVCDDVECEGWHMIPRAYAEGWWAWEVERGMRPPSALEFLS